MLLLGAACGERSRHDGEAAPSASCPSVTLAAESASASPASASPLTAPSGAPSARASSAALDPPLGYVRVFIDSVIPTESGGAVLLSPEPEADDARILPVFVGGTEALSIRLRVRDERFPRPLTHDLLDSALRALDARVQEARITKLVGTTFHGALLVSRRDGVLELDARPSDAVAMALGSDAPIFVAREVLDRAAVSRKELLEGQKTRQPGDPTML